MENYPSNSNSGKEPSKDRPTDKKVEKVVEGVVIQRKKSLGKRMAETFVGGEDARSVWSYVAFDVLIPAAKDMVVSAGEEALNRTFYGDARGRRSSGGKGHTSYTKFHGGSKLVSDPRDRGRPISQRARATHDFREIVLESRVEGEEVIDKLFELVSKYEVATVADLYDLLGISGNYTDNRWGWTDLRGATVTRVRSGWLLDIPAPEPID